jgi:CRISPR-associated protein Cmr4
MYKKQAVIFLQNITPLHAGAGDQLGIVDLPIQRESQTYYPKIESSSLKGALRQRFEIGLPGIENLTKINLAFGYDETGVGNTLKGEFSDAPGKFSRFFQGALAISDARLLLFPVKSMRGVMAWVTCPYILKRYLRDLTVTEHSVDSNLKTAIETISNKDLSANDFVGFCYAVSNAPVCLQKNNQHHVILEEYAFQVKTFDKLKTISDYLSQKSGIENLNEHLVILNDDDFGDFVRMSTEINTRIKIDDTTGTVATGQLFTEEFLPSESVMYSLIGASPVFQKNAKLEFKTADHVLDFFTNSLKLVKNIFQLGGNSSLGKGLIQTRI